MVAAAFPPQLLSKRIKWPLFVALLPMVVEMILAILDKYFEKKEWHKFILCCAIKYVWKKYVEKISGGISEEYRLYLDDVIGECLERTPVFVNHGEWCKYKNADV